ncbi:unnamed protein product [Effrenium voratum]|nr:unnamed protein product [Effrenium voratum]
MGGAGDLLQQINRCKQERAYLREADVWRYLDGMCQGLKALHDLRILHRDLKCANVFLSHSREGLIAKLGDFNVSKVAKRGLCMTQTGTPYYASPEALCARLVLAGLKRRLELRKADPKVKYPPRDPKVSKASSHLKGPSLIPPLVGGGGGGIYFFWPWETVETAFLQAQVNVCVCVHRASKSDRLLVAKLIWSRTTGYLSILP